MKRLGIVIGAVAAVLAISWWSIGSDWRRLIITMPTNADILFWNVDQRDAAFRMMDRVTFLVASDKIEDGPETRDLPVGPALEIDVDISAYMEENRTAGLIILHNGQVRFEAYGLDFSDSDRWTSFSVAKSFTSTLVGAAVKDGFITSLQDPVSDYIEGLKGSAYDDVTVEQLLTMSSGVAWNEDYEDPNSDVAKFNNHVSDDEQSNLVSYMKALPRAHAPGTVWNYSTGETNMIGVLVREATGRTLTDYVAEKVWGPAGMQQDGSWLLNDDGTEISGCCIQAATRDFARFGQFILEGAMVDGVSIVPNGWIPNASTARIRYGVDGEGYGYQWWTYDTGAYAARGIFGQGIYIDPSRQLVIASNSNWTSAVGARNGERAAQMEFYQIISDAIDAEEGEILE